MQKEGGFDSGSEQQGEPAVRAVHLGHSQLSEGLARRLLGGKPAALKHQLQQLGASEGQRVGLVTDSRSSLQEETDDLHAFVTASV